MLNLKSKMNSGSKVVFDHLIFTFEEFPGMVGETHTVCRCHLIEWDESGRPQIQHNLSYEQVKEIRDEIAEDGPDESFPDKLITARSIVYFYDELLELDTWLRTMSPEEQRKRDDNTNAEAISRVI